MIRKEYNSLVEYFSLFNPTYFTIQAHDTYLPRIIYIKSLMSTHLSLFHVTSSLVEVCLGGCWGSCRLFF